MRGQQVAQCHHGRAQRPTALEEAAVQTSPRYYFDFALQKNAQARGVTHTTPALTAMYGLRGANGVIVIRTKRPSPS